MGFNSGFKGLIRASQSKIRSRLQKYARKLFRHRYVRRTGHKTASSLHLYWHL